MALGVHEACADGGAVLTPVSLWGSLNRGGLIEGCFFFFSPLGLANDDEGAGEGDCRLRLWNNTT